MKNNTMSYCGLLCDNCPAYIGGKENTPERRASLADEWSTEDCSFRPEDMVCLGCTTLDSDKVFVYCRECEVRLNGLRRERANYAQVIFSKNR